MAPGLEQHFWHDFPSDALRYYKTQCVFFTCTCPYVSYMCSDNGRVYSSDLQFLCVRVCVHVCRLGLGGAVS